MGIIGQVESVWRYSVKRMRGEAMPEIFTGFSGVYGDRLYAFKSAAAPAGGRGHHPPGGPNRGRGLSNRSINGGENGGYAL